MKTYITYLLLLTILFVYVSATATTIHSAGNGNWEDANSWDMGRIPADGDAVHIHNGHTIRVTSNLYNNNPPLLRITISGNLDIPGGRKLNIANGSGIEIAASGQATGANGGSHINIGATTVWTGPGTLSGPHVLGVVLPVEWLSFTADIPSTTGGVELNWATASEKDNAGFSIERSETGEKWETIGSVSGAGNSTTITRYTFTDKNPLHGKNYYRIKQTDIDGQATWSTIIATHHQASGRANIQLSPNPATTSGPLQLCIQGASDSAIQITITDMTGRNVYTGTVPTDANGNGSFQITMGPNLTPGMYLVSGTGNLFTAQQRLSIQ